MKTRALSILSPWFIAIVANISGACASDSIGSSPEGDAGRSADGAGGAADGGAGPRVAENSVLLSLATRGDSATGAVFDGTSWNIHVFPAETARGELSASALAKDGTGMVVVAGTSELPPRFALWRGGSTWTDFADVLNAQHGGYNGIALTFCNGLYVLAYSTEQGLLVQLFDPKASTWSAPEFFVHGSGLGLPRFGTSARGRDETFLTVHHTRDLDSVGYGISWKPVFGAPAPSPGSMNALPPYWNVGGAILSQAMTPSGSTTPVQVSFVYKADKVQVHFGGEAAASASVPCEPSYDVVVREETPSQVSLLCTKTSTFVYEEVTGILQAGSPPTFAFQRRTIGPAYPNAGMVYLRGLGKDPNYLVTVQNAGNQDARAVLVRGLGSPPEPFATAGWSASAVVGP